MVLSRFNFKMSFAPIWVLSTFIDFSSFNQVLMEFSFSLGDNIPEGVDVASLIFVLSAVHPDNFSKVFKSIAGVLRPNGLLIFRDYGLYDMAQLRFGRGHKLGENFYVRQDGTRSVSHLLWLLGNLRFWPFSMFRSYFFSVEFLKDLATDAGFDVLSCHYVHRRTVNKKEGVDEPRVFVQGKFVRRWGELKIVCGAL